MLSGLRQLFEHAVQAPQHLLGLAASPVGLLPPLIKQLAIELGVAADRADQLVHLAQDLLAMLFEVGFIGTLSHFDAQTVHPFEEHGRCFHPVAQALGANQLHGLHQGAGGIAQENPIHRVMDVGFEASGVQKGGFQIHRLDQLQLFGVVAGLAEGFVNQLIQQRRLQPMSIALEGALGGDDHFLQFPQATELLQERTVGQAGGEAAKVLLEIGAQNIAAQGSARLELEVQLGFGRGVLVKLARGQAKADELLFGVGLG